MKLSISSFLLMGFLSAFAIESSLVSNFTFAVSQGPKSGSLWVLSRGDAGSGVSLIQLSNGESKVNVQSINSDYFDHNQSAVQDGVFSDVTAETRRTPSFFTSNFGWVLPWFEADSLNSFTQPKGLFFLRTQRVIEEILEEPIVELPSETNLPIHKAIGAFAFDSVKNHLWIAKGVLGLAKYTSDTQSSTPSLDYFVLNTKTNTLDSLKNGASIQKENPSLYSVAIHPTTQELWLASESGLYIEKAPQKITAVQELSKKRVTGLWMGGSPLQIIVESSIREKGKTKSSLWRSYNGSKFKEVVFRDTLSKTHKNAYDDLDYSVSEVAFIGNLAFLAVQTIEGSVSGLLKLDSVGAIPWSHSRQWLYGVEAGVLNNNSILTSVTSFPLDSKTTGLAVSSYGSGVSVSADTGKTWTHILNQSPVSNDLGSIRMIPSVIVATGKTQIAYKLSQDSKVTIEVFSYDMIKVKTIVKNAFREKNAVRSSKPTEDYWDGLDEHGRACAMGIYYIRVQDNHGHVGWGKAMSLGGAKK